MSSVIWSCAPIFINKNGGTTTDQICMYECSSDIILIISLLFIYYPGLLVMYRMQRGLSSH